MPVPTLKAYQPIGKRHIKYIHTMALRIWADTYDCREDDNGEAWRQSIKDAMTIHRNYLKTGTKVRHPKCAIRISPTPRTPKIKFKSQSKSEGFVDCPDGEGSYWLDPTTKLWMPMSLH